MPPNPPWLPPVPEQPNSWFKTSLKYPHPYPVPEGKPSPVVFTEELIKDIEGEYIPITDILKTEAWTVMELLAVSKIELTLAPKKFQVS